MLLQGCNKTAHFTSRICAPIWNQMPGRACASQLIQLRRAVNITQLRLFEESLTHTSICDRDPLRAPPDPLRAEMSLICEPACFIWMLLTNCRFSEGLLMWAEQTQAHFWLGEGLGPQGKGALRWKSRFVWLQFLQLSEASWSTVSG